MSYRNFLQEVKDGMRSPGYLLAASDPFLHSQAVALIRELVPEGERDFNFQSFDLAGAKDGGLSFEQMLDVLNTVPFFSGKKTRKSLVSISSGPPKVPSSYCSIRGR
jgi:DNA polymerase III delta subunit